jgi:hypothetical protein
MRKLWEDHVTLTRLAIVSYISELPDLQATEARLLKNQVDIGNAIKQFYGKKAAAKLTSLLKQHILGAVDLMAAARGGDQSAVAKASSAWNANGRQIADFLHAANPAEWPTKEMRSMMQVHLDQTLKEAVDRLGGRHAAGVRDYDAIHAHILEMPTCSAPGSSSSSRCASAEPQLPDRSRPAAAGRLGQRSRTISTGHSALCATRSATLPSEAMPRRPRLPTIRRSASRLAWTSASTGRRASSSAFTAPVASNFSPPDQDGGGAFAGHARRGAPETSPIARPPRPVPTAIRSAWRDRAATRRTSSGRPSTTRTLEFETPCSSRSHPRLTSSAAARSHRTQSPASSPVCQA